MATWDKERLPRKNENLEELGWVIFREDVPYYLYSIEKKSKDFLYNSFEMGSSIYLPSDTFG